MSLKPGTTTQRVVACTGTTTQCGSTSGWVVDLPDTGERVNVDLKLQLGTLVVASNVPSEAGCDDRRLQLAQLPELQHGNRRGQCGRGGRSKSCPRRSSSA